MLHLSKTGLSQKIVKTWYRPLVRVLGMDTFTCLVSALPGTPTHRHSLFGEQVHFDARLLHIKERFMLPVAHIEICAE